jgi:hypothetical protein
MALLAPLSLSLHRGLALGTPWPGLGRDLALPHPESPSLQMQLPRQDSDWSV